MRNAASVVTILAMTLASIVFASVAGSSEKSVSKLDTSSVDPSSDLREVERVLALSEDIEYGEYLSGECATCHSSGASADDAVPVIHGIDARRIVLALLEYRTGRRSNETMQSVAGALDDVEIAVLAHYLSTSGG